MMKNARIVMVFLIDWVGVSGFTYYPFMIWPGYGRDMAGVPFVHVHMAGHARIRVRGVSPYVWSVLRPRAWGGWIILR